MLVSVLRQCAESCSFSVVWSFCDFFVKKVQQNIDFWTLDLKDPYPSGDSAPNQTRKASCLILLLKQQINAFYARKSSQEMSFTVPETRKVR